MIDLSAPIVASPPETSEALRTEIELRDHARGARDIEALLGVPPDLLRNGEGWAVDEFTRLGTHNTTHVDAPWHYNSTIRGEPAQTIDQLPLEWFFAPGGVRDLAGKAARDAITPQDRDPALKAADHELADGEIVLIRTGRDEFLEAPDYM